MRHWDEAPTLTRSGSVWLGKGWVVLGEDYDHPWTREVDEGPPDLPAQPSARPLSIVNLDDERVDRIVASKRVARPGERPGARMVIVAL